MEKKQLYEEWEEQAARESGEDRERYGKWQETFGVYLTRKRKEWGYTLEQLGEGLCPAYQLSRIENEERMPDKPFRNRLLARVGISPDVYECFLFYNEYAPWKLRQQILNAVIRRDLRQAKKLITSYRQAYVKAESEGVCNRLEQQFCLAVEAQLARLAGCEEEKLAELFRKALFLTVPRADEEIRERALSPHEMDLMLEMLRYCHLPDRVRRYRELLTYVRDSHLDSLSRARIYPKAAYYFLRFAGAEDSGKCAAKGRSLEENEEALQLCHEGLDLL